MLKLGTVFSGIGAIEHALERMGIKYKIEFACDNGDVDILSKKIESNISDIMAEIEYLHNEVDEEYKQELITSKDILDSLCDRINNEEINISKIIKAYEEYRNSNFMNQNKKNTYSSLITSINENDNSLDKKIEAMKLSIKLESDVKRSELDDEPSKEIISSISKKNSNYKKIIKEIKLLS